MQKNSFDASAPSVQKEQGSLLLRIGLILISLAVVISLAAATFALYNNHQEKLKFDDIESKNKTVDANGVFEGQFRSKKAAWVLTDFEYYYKDDDLYITMLGTPGDREPLATDSEGYAHIRIETGETNIDKVYYIYGEKKVSLNIKKG